MVLGPAAFGIALLNILAMRRRSRIGGISGRNYLQIYANYIVSLPNFLYWRRVESCFVLFFIYYIIGELNARLFPITSGHRTLRLFAGSPSLQSAYNFVVLILNPFDYPSLSNISLVLGLLLQQQHMAYIPRTIAFFTNGFLFL